jgi:hypothetical protein
LNAGQGGNVVPVVSLRWIAASVVVAACSRAPETTSPPANRAFYYWRTTFQLSTTEQRAIADLHVTRIYLRMFDIEWSEAERGPSPIGKVTLGDAGRVPESVEIVPVVFLREEVFRKLPPKRIPELARTLWGDVQDRAKRLGFVPRELQLDCDWTDTTKGGFFAMLVQLRALAGVPLSATIRLHQVKYRERTGVPPIDRGMLMFYNMGKFSADPEARAIFDAAAAEKYLARVGEYPLPLDVALPIWSWTVHVRDDRVVGLMQSTDPDELASLDFLRASDAGYGVARTAFLHGTLLREGDILKIEVTGSSETLSAASMIAPRLASVATARTVTLFDLSERNLHRHGVDKLDQVFRSVR